MDPQNLKNISTRKLNFTSNKKDLKLSENNSIIKENLLDSKNTETSEINKNTNHRRNHTSAIGNLQINKFNNYLSNINIPKKNSLINMKNSSNSNPNDLKNVKSKKNLSPKISEKIYIYNAKNLKNTKSDLKKSFNRELKTKRSTNLLNLSNISDISTNNKISKSPNVLKKSSTSIDKHEKKSSIIPSSTKNSAIKKVNYNKQDNSPFKYNQMKLNEIDSTKISCLNNNNINILSSRLENNINNINMNNDMINNNMFTQSSIERCSLFNPKKISIFIFGGKPDFHTFKYDYDNDKWIKFQDIKITRIDFEAILIDEKNILILGGKNFSSTQKDTITDSIDIINLHSLEKKKFEYKLKQPKCNFGIVLLDSDFGSIEKNKLIFIGGGYNGLEVLNSFEYFDFKLIKWVDLPVMPTKRKEFSMLLGIDGLIYFIGGVDEKE